LASPQLTFRVDDAAVSDIDFLATRAGCDRAEFIRRAVMASVAADFQRLAVARTPSGGVGASRSDNLRPHGSSRNSICGTPRPSPPDTEIA
jgi:hypothetical protein